MGMFARGKKPGCAVRFPAHLPAGDAETRHTKAVAYDIAGVKHPTMPRVANVKLLWRRDIKKKIPKGCLQRVQCEVQQIE